MDTMSAFLRLIMQDIQFVQLLSEASHSGAHLTVLGMHVVGFRPSYGSKVVKVHVASQALLAHWALLHG
jgi:hypothetical protein